MERGQMRVEANVSLRPRGTEPFGVRVEVKNMNSFRAVERAIAFEIERQAAILDAGGDAASRRRAAGPRSAARPTGCGSRRRRTTTATSRSRTCRRSTSTRPGWPRCARALPELPAARRARYRDALGLSAYDAAVLVADPDASRAVRGDPRGRPVTRREARSPTGSPATTSRLRTSANRTADRGRAGRARRDRRRGRGGRDLARERRERSSSDHARVGRAGRDDHRADAASARSPTTRRCSAVVDAVARRQPGGGRRLPRRQGAGRRLPGRPGHEGDPRPGERGAVTASASYSRTG